MIQRELPFTNAVSPLLKGIGQIMLQNNAWTGLCFLAGICTGSFMMGLAALLAVVTGTCTAQVLRYDNAAIQSGLYGFSAALVGVALVTLFQPTVLIWLAILPGAAMTTILQHFFIVKKIPAYTFPFILVTWVLMLVHHYFPFAPAAVMDSPVTANHFLALLSRGFGQVIFQSSIAAGILFLAGVLISSPVAAVYGIGSIVISAVMAYWLGQPLNDIYMGLLSYNAVLCAIVFSGKKMQDFVLAFISVLLSVFIMVQMRKMQLTALTFPFVLASWLTLLVKATLLRAKN